MTPEREAALSVAEPDEAFRARLREFFAAHHPGRPPKDPQERLAWTKTWLATPFDNGYAGPGWPREFGGMALSFAHQVIYQEEFARARVPGPLGTGLNIAAPTIIKYATQEQKERWLAPMLRGDTVWAQGYSEPEAGSDLPSLRTTARRDGDGYVVNGQKVWTSHAGDADIFFALVPTGTRESRQKGITYLVIDARAPGVQVRPLRDLTGGHLFAEVFFDDVRVPAAVDLLSGGRLTVVAGTGYLRSEFLALNVDMSQRNELFDESLEVMRGVWGGLPFTHQGKHFSARGVASLPGPAQRGGPPVLISGNSALARARAARNQGWSPLMVSQEVARTSRTPGIGTVAELAAKIKEVRDAAAQRGSDPAALTIQVHTPQAGFIQRCGSAEEHRDHLGQLADAGVDSFVVRPPGDNLDRTIDSLHRYASAFLKE